MSEPTTTTPAPAKAPAEPSFVEKWGAPAAVSFLGLLFLELAVLTPMIRWGVDMRPVVGWIQATFGVAIDLGDGQPSWPLALGLAWGITRGLKPLQIAAGIALTPVVAKLMRHQPPPAT